MKRKVCEKCKHYIQHYTYNQKLGFIKVYCGHCRKKLIKEKDCDNFEQCLSVYNDEIDILDLFIKCNNEINTLTYKTGLLCGLITQLKTKIENNINKI